MRQLAPSRHALFSLALLLIAVLPMKAHRRIIQLPSLGPRKGKQINATPVFRKLLEGLPPDLVKGGDTLELRFRPGRYHFTREGAVEREYFISNHDHAAMGLHGKPCDEEQGKREEGVSGGSELAHERDVGVERGGK